MNVTSVVPSSSYINRWFSDAMTYEILRERMLSGEFNRLSPQDKAFILAFINKQEWIVLAFKKDDEPFIKVLIEAGADVNAVDADGRDIWSYTTPDMFQWLYKRGVMVDGNKISSFIFLQNCATVSSRSNDLITEWTELLLMVLQDLSLEDCGALDGWNLDYLITMAKEQSGNIPKMLSEIALKIIKEKPLEALKIARELLARNEDQDYKMYLIGLIKAGSLQNRLIEQIVTDTEILYWNTNNTIFFEALGECWQPEGDLLSLSQTAGNLTFGIYIKAILNTTTLDDAARLYSRLRHFPDMAGLDETIKKRLFHHTDHLQTIERRTIWQAVAMRDCSYEDLMQMKKLGFDPNWQDPVHAQTFLFTQSAGHVRDQHGQAHIGFNLDHVDAHGNNALEHHCRNFNEESFHAIETLASLRVRLSAQFPDVQTCRSTFPDNNYLQAMLGTWLLHPLRFTGGMMYRTMSQENVSLLRNAVCKDSALKSRLKKSLNLETGRQIEKESRREAVEGGWKERYHEADAAKLDTYLKDNHSKESSLSFLATFWKGIVPSNIVSITLESPLASLVLRAMQEQHRQLNAGTLEKPCKFSELFCSSLQHNDMVYLNRYLFDNPALMRILVHDYLHANVISILPGGGSKTNYGETVHALISRMDKLLQLPTFLSDLPKWHQTLMQSFDNRLPAVPAETLHIAAGAGIRVLGRTVVVTSNGSCDAFKLLKPGEKYDYFSQEHSVCKALNEIAWQFESRIIQPAGIYAVRQLPEAFAPYQDQWGGGLANKFVFHYKAHPDTYVYLQDVPADKYEKARRKTLHDAARLIRLGIYPDLAAMFHNHQQSRRYVLLVDVMARLMVDNKTASSNSAGGGGRLETPFVKTQYPNARLSGITDWRDASLYYCQENPFHKIRDMRLRKKEKGPVKYFYQMNALSAVLLIDMLIVAERYMKCNELQWQNQGLNERFGRKLMEGFACLFASYSKQPYPKTLQFAGECGIDWTLAAKQIAFWLDTGANGYPQWAAQGKIPPGLYKEGVECEVNMEGAVNFNREHGFCTNDHPDIGVYNGPLALDEFEKAAHLLFNAVALAEPLISLSEPVRSHGQDVTDEKTM